MLVSIVTETTKRDMVGLRVSLLAKESVTLSQQSSANWMPENVGRLSIGMGCRHPVKICKASCWTWFIKSECQHCDTVLVQSI